MTMGDAEAVGEKKNKNKKKKVRINDNASAIFYLTSILFCREHIYYVCAGLHTISQAQCT